MENGRTGMGVEGQTGKGGPAEPALDLLRETFPNAVLEAFVSHGDATALVRPESLLQVMEFLKGHARLDFDVLLDITAVDYLGREPRFEVVYQLLSLSFSRRLCVKVRLDDGESSLSSLCSLWGSANWLEREVWDMFGIRFAGHPNLKRILMYEEFEGHPLRKDYPIRRRQPRIGPKN
jgi:NADH-quinone oxidoreductase subunit C